MPKPEDLARLNRRVLISNSASFGVLLFGLTSVILYVRPSWLGVFSKAGEDYQGETSCMKNIKKHPTHFRISSYIGGLFLVLVLVSFVVGIYFQQRGHIELSHKFAFSFLINTALLISWLLFRMKLCKCPTCGKWLSKLAAGDKSKSRKFICPKCDIIWDTGYVMYFEFDDPG